MDQYVTRPHASTVVVTKHNPTPGQLRKTQCSQVKWFSACKNVTLHIKVFSGEVQLLISLLFMRQESAGGQTHPPKHHPEKQKENVINYKQRQATLSIDPLYFKCYIIVLLIGSCLTAQKCLRHFLNSHILEYENKSV